MWRTSLVFPTGRSASNEFSVFVYLRIFFFCLQFFVGFFFLLNVCLQFFVFCFFFKINLFIYFWLCWVFVSVRGLSPAVASGGHSSSRCAGLSLSWPLLLRSTGSRRAGSVVVAHGLSRSAACGIFPDQGSNPCPLHWQADSQPLRHQGSPCLQFLNIVLLSIELLTVFFCLALWINHSTAFWPSLFLWKFSCESYCFPLYMKSCFSLIAFKFFFVFFFVCFLPAVQLWWVSVWISLYLSYLQFIELLGSRN